MATRVVLVIHYRSSPGIAVAACGERGLLLRFSIQRSLVSCLVCLEKRDASVARWAAKFERAKAMKALRG